MSDFKFDIYDYTETLRHRPAEDIEIGLSIYQLKGIISDRMLIGLGYEVVMVIWGRGKIRKNLFRLQNSSVFPGVCMLLGCIGAIYKPTFRFSFRDCYISKFICFFVVN